MGKQNSCKTLIQLHLTTVTLSCDSISLSINRSAYAGYNEREVGAHNIIRYC